MPVQITTRQVTRSEVKEVRRYPFPVYSFPILTHQIITGQHIGLLSPDSPTQGLGTFNLVDDLAIVSHCAQTRRTALVHCWSRATWEEVSEGQLAWLADDGKGKEIEILVLRDVNTTPELPYLHLITLAELKTSLQPLATTLGLTLSFTDVPTRVPDGVFTVDTSTGKISIIDLPPPRKNFCMLDVSPTFPLAPTSPAFRRYVVALLKCETRVTLYADNYPPFLQYDGQTEVFTPRLGDAARSLLLARRAGKSFDEVSKMAKTMGREAGTEVFPREEMQKLGMMLDAAVRVGEWCEVCGASGTACAGCLGASYCGKEHQRMGWRELKEWYVFRIVRERKVDGPLFPGARLVRRRARLDAALWPSGAGGGRVCA